MTKEEKAEMEALMAENRRLIATINRVSQKCKTTLEHLKFFPSENAKSLKTTNLANEILRIVDLF